MFKCEKHSKLGPKNHPLNRRKKVLYNALVDAYNAAPSRRGWGKGFEGCTQSNPVLAVSRLSRAIGWLSVRTGLHFYLFYCFYHLVYRVFRAGSDRFHQNRVMFFCTMGEVGCIRSDPQLSVESFLGTK